jgi:hypothetical protein
VRARFSSSSTPTPTTAASGGSGGTSSSARTFEPVREGGNNQVALDLVVAKLQSTVREQAERGD